MARKYYRYYRIDAYFGGATCNFLVRYEGTDHPSDESLSSIVASKMKNEKLDPSALKIKKNQINEKDYFKGTKMTRHFLK
jgi:hypothetical protein